MSFWDWASLRLVVWPGRTDVVDTLDFFADTMPLHILRKLLSLLEPSNFQEPSLFSFFWVLLGLPGLLGYDKV